MPINTFRYIIMFRTPEDIKLLKKKIRNKILAQPGEYTVYYVTTFFRKEKDQKEHYRVYGHVKRVNDELLRIGKVRFVREEPTHSLGIKRIFEVVKKW